MTPAIGIHKRIPFADYHAWEAVSHSALKTLRDKTPAHLAYERAHPREATPAMRLGAAIHMAVLEPAEFDSRYCQGPEDARTKEGKARLAEILAWNPQADILRGPDWSTCHGVAWAVRNHPTARLLLDGETECSAAWEQDGLLCKARFDAVSKDTRTIVDLKTTRDASPDGFGRAIFNLGYHIQAAHYLRGAEALGMGIRHFVLIAVETEPPHLVATYRLQDGAVAAGAEELDGLLGRYAECVRTNRWPGYPVEPVEITIPEWAMREAYALEEVHV